MGFVFNSAVWAQNGLYTNASPQNLSTDSTTASDHCCVFVNYSFPASVTNFAVTPTNAFTSSGSQGGLFSPLSQTYTLTNTDAIPLFWSVTKTSIWLTVSTLATNLTLGGGASTNIAASINSAANSLCPGTYTDTINFSNTATSVSFSRDVTLNIGGLPVAASFTGSPTNGTTDTNIVNGGQISSASFGQGHGGSVSVAVAGLLSIDGANSSAFTGLTPQAGADSAGAGTVAVAAGSLSIANGGGVSSDTKGAGNAGSISVAVGGAVTIDAAGSTVFTGISSDSGIGSGNAGTVSISAGSALLTNRGEVSTSTFGAGNAGGVSIAVAGGLSLSERSP
jgi:hypothetical protein